MASSDKYIVPDIIISQTEHGFEMQLSDETSPQIVISTCIRSLTLEKDTVDGGEGTTSRGKPTAEWVRQRIGQRNQTLLGLAEDLCVQGELQKEVENWPVDAETGG